MDPGYDSSTTVYTPDGRVLQIEYASKVVDKSYTIIGLVGKDAVVLAAHKVIPTPLYEPDADGRIFQVDRNIGIAVAGSSADGNYVVEVARQEANNFREEINTGTCIPVRELCERVAGCVHAYTMYSAARPFGLTILVASWDEDDGPQLYKIDPTGAYYGYSACASGRARPQALDQIEGLRLKSMGRKQLVETAGEIIYKIHDESRYRDFRFEMGISGEFTGGRLLLNPTELTEMARSAGEAAVEEDYSDESPSSSSSL